MLVLALFATSVSGQKTEVGGLAGAGTFAGEGVPYRTFWIAGAEACLFCDGRYALFVEYSHFGAADKRGKTKITSADLVSGGLRIQRFQGRVRPFFDIGISGGQDRFESRAGRAIKDSHNLVGLALGGGATFSMSERWYVRPTVRVQVMNGLHVVASVVASVGYRF